MSKFIKNYTTINYKSFLKLKFLLNEQVLKNNLDSRAIRKLF